MMTKMVDSENTNVEKKVRVPINSNINRTWEMQGKTRKIRIPKRVKSTRELNQEEIQRLRKKEQYEKSLNYKLKEIGLPSVEMSKASEEEEDRRISKVMEILKQHSSSSICNQEHDNPSTPTLKESNKHDKSKTSKNTKMKASRRRIIHPSKQIAIQNQPVWLQELLLPSWKRTRNLSELEKYKGYLELKTDMENKFRLVEVQTRLKDISKVPRYSYKLWAEHVPIYLPSKSNKSDEKVQEDDSEVPTQKNCFAEKHYFRYDSIGWMKGEGYVKALISTFADANMEEIYKTLHPLLLPVKEETKESSTISHNNVPCKVLELGSGSGQHAVMFCQRNPDQIIWQPSDVSPTCITSVDKRSNFHGVQYQEGIERESAMDETKDAMTNKNTGNCLKCLHLNSNRLTTAMETLSEEWKSVDIMVALNVLAYAPPNLQQTLWELGKNVIKVGGGIFIYGLFLTQMQKDSQNKDINESKEKPGVLIEAERLNLRLKHINPEWGVRVVDDLIEFAKENGFELEMKYDLKYYYMGLFFRRVNEYRNEENSKIDKKVSNDGETN